MALNDEEYLSLMCSPAGQGMSFATTRRSMQTLTLCYPTEPSEFYQEYVASIQQTSTCPLAYLDPGSITRLTPLACSLRQRYPGI